MKRIALTVALILLALPAWAATETRSIPAGSTAVQVMSPDVKRYVLTVQSGAATQDALCSQTDTSVATGVAISSAAATTFIPENPVYCRSVNGATLTVTYSVRGDFPFVVEVNCSTGSPVALLAKGQAYGATRIRFFNDAGTATTICPTAAALCVSSAGVTLEAAVGAEFEVTSEAAARSPWSCAASGANPIAVLVE